MKKKAILVLLIVMVGGTLLFSQTLDQILAKNYATRGGLEKLKAIKTIYSEGKTVIAIQNMEIPAKIWMKKPNKMRMEMVVMEKTLVMGFDGQKAWMIVPFLGTDDAQEMPAEQSKEFSEQADSMDPLVDYKEKGDQLEFIGKEDMEGSPVYKLKLTKKNGKITFFYLDTDSCIELKTTSFVKAGEQELQVDTLLGDYKEVDGIMIPFSMEIKGGPSSMKIVLNNIKFNVEADDSMFIMPPKKAQPIETEKK